MSWSSSRQFMFGALFFFMLALVLSVPIYFIFFNQKTTCFDGKQAKNEGGIDCGGVCKRACVQDVVSEPIVLWSRAFNVSGNVYNLAAYVQNPNVQHIARPVPYSFKVFDANNVLIAERRGVTNIPPVKSFPIFEQSIDTDQQVPAKVSFAFDESILWEKYESVTPEVVVTPVVLTEVATTPRITARLKNETLHRFENTEVIVIVYGTNGNAIAVSRTYVAELLSQAEAPLVFTWPKPFSEPVTKIEIIPKLPFK